MKTQFMAALLLLLSGYVLGRGSSPAAVASAAQPAAGHVYEMRTYTATEGKLANVNARFRDHTQRIFAKHNMKSVGYWTPLEAPTGPPQAAPCTAPKPDTTLIYILEHPSREEATKNWAAFRADPEWQKAKTESELAGPIVAKAESVFLTPTDYSPIK
jgi:hypothetical protein